MDAYEATKIVLQRIQSLDPENASKIMGLLLIQDHGEKEMIRLALGPEALVHSVILKARKELSLQANSPKTPSSPYSFSRQNSFSRFSGGVNLPSPLSIPKNSSVFRAQEDLMSPGNGGITKLAGGTTSSAMNSSAAPFYGNGEVDFIDEFQLQDQLSFLNDGSPRKNSEIGYLQQDLASSPSGVGGEGMMFPSYGGGGGGAAAEWGGSVNGLHHRRSFSVSDICFGSEDPNCGLGWKPCLYYARGYCKNGTSCRFLHGGGLGEGGLVGADNAAMAGSPSEFEMMQQCQELLRSKSAARQQQRLAAASQLIGSADFPYSPVAAEKCMNFFLQQQQLQAESPRGDFRINGGPGMVNPGSRQIYLTFPADSTFKEEDVSNYFSIYGPVQDVRIPYQQKRMFGFVTFVYPETVRIILAKGNPHFVCDSRVLVKPYKEKGKVPEKIRKQHHQFAERGEFAGCGSPTGLEQGDLYDLPLGARMLYNAQEMLWGKKLEQQAELQQAIEHQNRRLMDLQLFDVKRNRHHRTLSSGIISPPLNSVSLSADQSSAKTPQDDCLSPFDANQETVSRQEGNLPEKEKESSTEYIKADIGNGKESPLKEQSILPESLEHNLPDSPFASPKATSEYITSFSNEAEEATKVAPGVATSSVKTDLINSSLFPASTSLDISPLKSCYFLPSFAPGHGTVGM